MEKLKFKTTFVYNSKLWELTGFEPGHNESQNRQIR